MLIRFGYVAIAINLKDASTSKTITLANLQKLSGNKEKHLRLKQIAKENLDNLLRVIRYNADEKIHVYRITSKLIPFATYPLDFEWNYLKDFKNEFSAIGTSIKESGLRISAHPDHYTVINSPDQKVLTDSINDLNYHDHIFKAMGLGHKAKLVVHIGGFYQNKPKSIKRFIDIFKQLPLSLQTRIVLENDDKIYTAQEVLQICNILEIPMVLDLHHHACNPSENLSKILPDIWATWGKEQPKIHVSSPKESQRPRPHSDFIDSTGLIDFLKLAYTLKRDFDIMVEAKMKDKALFKLIEDLSAYSGINQLDPSTLELS